jgi:hypothetical protein
LPAFGRSNCPWTRIQCATPFSFRAAPCCL